MSVRMRLRRMGTRKKAFYRIVVADQRCSRDGRFIDLVGTYDPRADPPAIKLDREKCERWLKHGVQPSDVVRSILAKEGLLDRSALPTRPSKPAAEPAPAAEAVSPAPQAAEAPPEPEPAAEAAATEEQPAAAEEQSAAAEGEGQV